MNNSTNKIKVSHLSTFGFPIRGLTPYSDSLLRNLIALNNITNIKVNYRSRLFDKLHPSSQQDQQTNSAGDLKIGFLNPFRWKNAFRKKTDIIHAQYWSVIQIPSLLGVLFYAKLKRIKIVITVHNAAQHEALFFTHFFEKKIYNLATKLIVHTKNGLSLIEKKYLIPKEKLCVIPHGVDIQDTSNVKATKYDYQLLNLNCDKSYIIFFGNIRNYKGIDVLLDAWNIAAQSLPNCELVVAGRLWTGNTLLKRLSGAILGTKKLADKILNLKNKKLPKQTTYILNFLSEDQCTSLFRIANLAVFPYLKFESQSGAALKVIAYHVPAIVSNKGGLSEVALDDSYILNENFDATSLAKVIIEKMAIDKETANKSHFNTLKEISWHNVAQLHERVYSNL